MPRHSKACLVDVYISTGEIEIYKEINMRTIYKKIRATILISITIVFNRVSTCFKLKGLMYNFNWFNVV